MANSPTRIAFTLREVVVLEFQEFGRLLPPFEDTDVGIVYEPAFGLRFDREEDRLLISVRIRAVLGSLMEVSEAESPVEVASLEVLCDFGLQVDDLAGLTEKRLLPKTFVAHLVGMTLSTARGVLIGRAKHPVFGRAPLPIASPISFIDHILDDNSVDWVEAGNP